MQKYLFAVSLLIKIWDTKIVQWKKHDISGLDVKVL